MKYNSNISLRPETMFVCHLLILVFILLVFVDSLPQSQDSLLESMSSRPDCDDDSKNRLKRAAAGISDGSKDEDLFLGLKTNPFSLSILNLGKYQATITPSFQAARMHQQI